MQQDGIGLADHQIAVRTRCREHCFDNRLIMRAVADSMVRLPPLIITEAQVNELMGKARSDLDLTVAEMLG